MKRPIILIASLLLIGALLAGCGALDAGALLPGPTPLPGAAGTPLPDAQVAFVVSLPQTTPADAEVAIEFVDIVTGVPYHTDRRAMTRSEDGRWRLDARMPAGSLLRYRYLLTAPEAMSEATAYSQPVRYRVAHVPGPVQIEDQVAAWGQGSYQGPTGRILGRVYQPGGEPVPEMIVSAGGQSTFTDSEGRFRLEDLPTGLHNVVAYHPEGRYHVAQQGAILAENSTTPAEFEVRQAREVTMTFQVTVPGNTPSGVPLRMAGSLAGLGTMFEEMPGGGEASAARMPQLVPVDGSTYLLLASMYAGTDLRYKYTFGDGLWNAERTANGGFVTRQLIVPETDTTISDTVASWGAEAAREVRFDVNPPPNTPAGDEVSLQLNPFAWFEPLPIVARDDGSWSYVLRGPLDFAGSFEYRFCRNFECGRAGSSLAEPAGSLAAGGGQTVADEIESWAWWSGPAAAEFNRDQITPRPDWRVGAELAPLYRPTWAQYEQRSLARVAELNANSVTFTPTWILDDDRSVPMIEFDPRAARFQQQFEQAAAAAAQANLALSLRPELLPQTESLDEWWQTGSRDATWWAVWFDEYRSFLLSQADLARRAGAERLIISGAQVAPALPAGTLADGSPSGVPADAESRWRQLLEEVRSVYSGEVAFEIELAESVRAVPPFLDAVDAVHVYWHYPLAETSGAGLDVLTQEAELGLQRVLAVVPADMSVVISAEYLAIDGSAAACPRPAEGGCLPAADFDAGAVVSDQHPVNLQAQTEALQAVLRAAAAEPRVAGFSARRFYPLAALQDKSASVYGKPAAEMLSYEYARLLGLE